MKAVIMFEGIYSYYSYFAC